MAVNRVMFFLAGAVVGAAGMAFATSPKGKRVISDVIQGGGELKENMAARMETLKEDIEDYVAEKKFKKAQKNGAAGETEDSASPSEEPV